MCFIDASEAFDRVNHEKLFLKLYNRRVPLIRILVYWYGHQSMFVKWGNNMSDPFKARNGVRQGSVLSPYPSNIYTDGLSKL